MYAALPPAEDKSAEQVKLIVNMVVAVFLIIGFMLVLQYFNFIYLRDIPMVGGWLMDVYERVFGVPKVLILHGDDSIGDWVLLQERLSKKLIFFSADVDVRRFDAGIGNVLSQYGLVIVEDAKTLDKDKLLNLMDYVKGGGNLMWVGDAGTKGVVEHEGDIIKNQTGWKRKLICIKEVTFSECDCDTVGKEGSTCKFLRDPAEQREIDFRDVLGTHYHGNVGVVKPTLEIVDKGHWSVIGIRTSFVLENLTNVTNITNMFDTALVANIIYSDDTFPSVVVNDMPGSWGAVIYFGYPPEETMEIVLPLVERLRY